MKLAEDVPADSNYTFCKARNGSQSDTNEKS